MAQAPIHTQRGALKLLNQYPTTVLPTFYIVTLPIVEYNGTNRCVLFDARTRPAPTRKDY